MATYMQGALKSGSTPSEPSGATVVAASDLGYATFAKSVTLQAATVAAVDGTIVLPVGAQIVGLYIDTTVAWTATGAVTFTAGTASAGTQYVTSVDLKTVTRGAPTLTAAQLLAMNNISTNTSLVCTATTASGSNAVGTTIVTVLYIPKS